MLFDDVSDPGQANPTSATATQTGCTASRTTTSRTLFLGSRALRRPIKDDSGTLGPMHR